MTLAPGLTAAVLQVHNEVGGSIVLGPCIKHKHIPILFCASKTSICVMHLIFVFLPKKIHFDFRFILYVYFSFINELKFAIIKFYLPKRIK